MIADPRVAPPPGWASPHTAAETLPAGNRAAAAVEHPAVGVGDEPAARAERARADRDRVVWALLVVDGRSYNEVAAELFLSVKTVEFHLGNVFRKLGVRSRRELRGRLPSV